MTDKEHETTDPYAGLPFPRTDLSLKALRHAHGLEPPAIFNHSLRTYLYGRSLGERQVLQPGHDYDDELLFVGCALHDAGLSLEGDGDQTFNVDGADLAARFSSPTRGWPPTASRSSGTPSPSIRS
ncbi:HD domain-containing protein [Streptomyces milbemycinicus]|uniref:HD domain-containing protein n=1 Tax=Streptomyces milbemycinicus TaxID=476552 RepID=A0ABW8LWZ3_9ACTN